MSKYIDTEKLTKFKEALADIIVSSQGISTYQDCKNIAEREALLLISTLQHEQPNNIIQWTGNNLKEVIDFTGKSPRFEEWFKSWDEYENYVHTHNDILKLFCEDGSHYEVPVGAWIVKTPDGYNVPLVARFIHAKQEQSDNWDKQYQEDNLQTRFAFYTYKDEDGILYLSNVFVEETSRNKGFGTKILQAAENVAEAIGANTIRLKVKQNSSANGWYRKHGYRDLVSEDKYDWLEKNLEYQKLKQEQPKQPDEQPEYGYLYTEYIHGKKPRWNVGDVIAYYVCTSNEVGEYVIGKVSNVEFDDEEGWLYTFENKDVYNEQSLVVEEGAYKKN